eukprot:COSAG02_NODE_9956_length_2064_cov_3.817846_1_plen_56_part_10
MPVDKVSVLPPEKFVPTTLQSMEEAMATASQAMERARLDDSPGAIEREAAVLRLQR